MHETLPAVLRPDDLRRILKISAVKAYAIAHAIGQRHGRLIFITGEALAQWLAARETVTPPTQKISETSELPPLPPSENAS
jgi:hypothetical protein